ncbi:nuclear transport factor 2 family protein [Mycobacterium sp. 360MFTsu5.1]|uniref:nuclear transport factor 2 family protein n=1 Tax=Mycobacterium sp. 360MFTsu5.1 TaxID=1172186 RepID=UPI0003A8B060|nr:nuclear transport factor 2 family protein [Mycobacterium sp. 360MFTsu5.1]
MNREANRALTLQFFDNWFSGRIEDALTLVAEDFTFTVPGDPARFPLAGTYDRAGWTEMLARVSAVMQGGVEADILACVADDEQAVVVAHTFGTSRNGRQYDNDLCYVVRIKSGRLASCREYLDTIHANEVLAEST